MAIVILVLYILICLEFVNIFIKVVQRGAPIPKRRYSKLVNKIYYTEKGTPYLVQNFNDPNHQDIESFKFPSTLFKYYIEDEGIVFRWSRLHRTIENRLLTTSRDIIPDELEETKIFD